MYIPALKDIGGERYWARKSEFNTHKAEPEYGIHTHPPHGYREKKNRVFVESIHFPENYKLPAYARFRTVFKYWVWLHKDDYSESYIQDTMCTAYKRMEPLHDMPFRKVRADDVHNCMTGLTQSCRNAVIGLYHAMDMLAYEQDVITRRYSLQLKSVKSARAYENKFSEDEIKLLRQHVGEIEVDATLVLLYTGMTAQEICMLAKGQIYDGYIHIVRDRTPYSARKIPLHPAIADCLTHVVSYLEERDAEEAEANDIYGTTESFLKAYKPMSEAELTGRYLMAIAPYTDRHHFLHECRHTFYNKLQDQHVEGYVIDVLMGHAPQDAGQRHYARFSIDRKRESIMKLWE